jgi:hypothetical protein
VNTVMNLRVPYNAGKFLSTCTIGGFSSRAEHHEVSYYEVIVQACTLNDTKVDINKSDRRS